MPISRARSKILSFMQLSGKVAVVTGASRGIGLSFAEALLERGSTVFGLARNAEALARLEGSLGNSFTGIVCDVRDAAQVSSAFSQIMDSAGRIDILINNAGLGIFERLESMSLDNWSVQLDTNLTGVFLCTREAIPVMKRQGEEAPVGGHIVNIASIAGLIGNPQLGAYNATKFGLRGLTESLMKEVRNDGIKVTGIYPGSIQTRFFEQIPDMEADEHMMQPDDLAETVMHVLEASDNYLISEVVMRPLRPRPKQ
jgi:NAD(P)-dependent dehydrogenase (short-subunit alcohol dehydrogenase family)